ncbi:MAG: HlyD family efflux transporter periplasmic adaptor subunit [Burkholderiaceae bacterium]
MAEVYVPRMRQVLSRVAGTAIGTGLLLSMLSGCSEPPASGWSGYAEADYVYVASPVAGQLASVAVVAGQQVAPGAPLFALDAENEVAARAGAAARVAAAQAQLADLEKGKRSEELAVSDAQLAQARVSAALAQRELERQQRLVAQGFVSKAVIDEATSNLHQAQGRVDELVAALRVARLPARSDARAASQASAQAAREALRQSTWLEGQTHQNAPVQAQVSEVFYQPGEFVAAGQPVVALLPPANVKARFFVPEAELASIRLGQSVRLVCDGCAGPIAATVSRIATQAEYTPPVIYSNAQRAKLVFMVEARPDAALAMPIKPGQPLEVFRADVPAAGASAAKTRTP